MATATTELPAKLNLECLICDVFNAGEIVNHVATGIGMRRLPLEPMSEDEAEALVHAIQQMQTANRALRTAFYETSKNHNLVPFRARS